MTAVVDIVVVIGVVGVVFGGMLCRISSGLTPQVAQQ